MINDDTVKLLKECNAGIKMGVVSIDDVLDNVKDKNLKSILSKNMEQHQKLGSKTHEMLDTYGEAGKEPNPMAKSMSWVKTNMMLAVKDSDNTIADLLTDGCNMGVKSLHRYMNKYKAADENSKNIAKQIIGLEQQLTEDLRQYL